MRAIIKTFNLYILIVLFRVYDLLFLDNIWVFSILFFLDNGFYFIKAIVTVVFIAY